MPRYRQKPDVPSRDFPRPYYQPVDWPPVREYAQPGRYETNDLDMPGETYDGFGRALPKRGWSNHTPAGPDDRSIYPKRR